MMSTAEAADRLGVSERQVRRLATAGGLTGRRVGGRWLIDADAVRDRCRSEPKTGRPLSARMAWSFLAAMGTVLESPPASDPMEGEDRRIRHRLRTLIAHAPPPERWDRWLRKRAARQRVWVHPGVIEHLGEDQRLWPAGADVVAGSGLGITGGDRDRFYVHEDVFDAVLADHRARLSDEGRVTLMVVPAEAAEVAEVALGRPGEPVPSAVVLVDLLGSSHVRERHLAARELAVARRELCRAFGVDRAAS